MFFKYFDADDAGGESFDLHSSQHATVRAAILLHQRADVDAQFAEQDLLHLLQGDGARVGFAVRFACLIFVFAEVGLLGSEGEISDEAKAGSTGKMQGNFFMWARFGELKFRVTSWCANLAI